MFLPHSVDPAIPSVPNIPENFDLGSASPPTGHEKTIESLDARHDNDRAGYERSPGGISLFSFCLKGVDFPWAAEGSNLEE